MIEIRYSKKFLKHFEKAPPKIRAKFQERIVVFVKNQFHPILNTHKLRGEYKNYYSINITGDWRALYEKQKNGKIIFFWMIGTHSELY